MSKYANRLSQDEKTVKAGAVLIAEARAKALVEQKISGLKAEKAANEGYYEQALGANPFNINTVFELTAQMAKNNADLVIAESILNSEFSN